MKTKGLTLIELMIVIAVVAILICLVYASVEGKFGEVPKYKIECKGMQTMHSRAAPRVEDNSLKFFDMEGNRIVIFNSDCLATELAE